MSQRISILPETITNKIAAGEVVERPASVIKELLENSLDAGASEISVEVVAGGRRLIRISDNGHGMSRDDALLCLERHATSKIRQESDLDGILTLGFRGEALPSIASVSRFRLATRERESLEGVEINVEGGKVRDVKACGMAVGTVISVEQLFFNTPARLKFLKSAETENGHIADVVTRMAVSRPDVAFSLTMDTKATITTHRGDLLRRLGQCVGKESITRLYEVAADSEPTSIHGYISSPMLARSNNAALYTYINGRFVRDKVVQHAIMQAYRGVLDRGRYPVVALNITLPAGEVDVNVHPTKHEVRFRRQGAVHDFIQQAIEAVLRSSPWLTPRGTPPSTTVQPAANQAHKERVAAAAQTYLTLPPRSDQNLDRLSASHMAEQRTPPQPATVPSPSGLQVPQAVTVAEPPQTFQPDNRPTSVPGYFSRLATIGQFHGEYLLCQAGEELVIIDQHAASERVAFQRLRQQFHQSGVERQTLLFPETLELSHSEVAAAERFHDQLLAFGFELEPFGGGTLLMTAVPHLVAERGAAQLLRDLINDLESMGKSAAFQEAEDRLLARIACHSVVRGFHPLEERQIRELLRSMDATDFAASCPHGRPVSHVITLHELEKIFNRV